MLLLQGAKREAIIRLLVWMAFGILVYLVYGRSHSEINNPRIIADEPMRVLHENYSVDSVNYHNYQGYTDEHLRRQYERQLARRMGTAHHDPCPEDGEHEMYPYQPHQLHHPDHHHQDEDGPADQGSGVGGGELGSTPTDSGTGTGLMRTRTVSEIQEDGQSSCSPRSSTAHEPIALHRVSPVDERNQPQ